MQFDLLCGGIFAVETQFKLSQQYPLAPKY